MGNLSRITGNISGYGDLVAGKLLLNSYVVEMDFLVFTLRVMNLVFVCIASFFACLAASFNAFSTITESLILSFSFFITPHLTHCKSLYSTFVVIGPSLYIF